MYCANCGKPIQEGQNFCSICGQPAAAASGSTSGSALPIPPPPPPPPVPVQAWASPSSVAPGSYQSRLARHVRILGILWIVVSVLRILPGLTLMGFGHFGFPFMMFPMHFPGFLAPILGGIGAILTISALAGIAAGWGLLDRRAWARILAIVLGCLKLIEFPIGTALGVYTLWVLVSDGAEAEYRSLARAN